MTSSAEHLIAGWHAVFAALRSPEPLLGEVWLKSGREDGRSRDLRALAEERGVKLRLVEPRALDERAPGLRHQGVIGFARDARVWGEDDLWPLLDVLTGPPFLLVLDGVQDPHNLGACLRTADAAGVHAVIAPKDRAVGLSPGARKAAAGAAETLPFFQVTNLARTLRDLKERGIWLVGTAGDAKQSIYEIDLKGPLALVMGAEEGGMRRLTRESCDFLASIPMHGSVESLNVSVATAICLYEAVRRRRARETG